MDIKYLNTTFDDADNLVEIRIAAMKESLERVGRFDPQRARNRFMSSFEPENTKYIILNNAKIGFFVVKWKSHEMSLEHLYVLPEYQSRGVGAVVLDAVFSQADLNALPLTVGALRESASNRFYQRHGFVKFGESEWDIFYIRQPKIKL